MSGPQNNQNELGFAQDASHHTGISLKERHKIYMRTWRISHLEEQIKCQKNWAERNNERVREHRKKWRDSKPDQRHCHRTVAKLIRKKEVEKPTRCSKCNGSGIIEAHHPDYSKPNVFEWLCQPCHREKTTKWGSVSK